MTALLLLCALWFVGLAEEEEEIPLSEARTMLLEGRVHEADDVVRHHRAHHGEDRTLEEEVELLVLEGLVAQQLDDHGTAVWSFREAMRLQPERTSVNLYLAQSLFTLGDPEGARRALVLGEGAGERLPAYFLLRARVEQGLDRLDRAWHALDRGQQLHPGHPALLREEALVLLRMGLVEAAREPARFALGANLDDRDTWLVLAAALRGAGDIDASLALLEEAHLRFPDDHDLLVRLAHGWAQAGQPQTAARLFMRAHAEQPDYAFEIDDQLRLAERPRSGLVFNAQVVDPDDKLPQRLALLVDMERWDRAVAMAPALDALDEVPDAVRYQLAYAAYVVGDADVVRRQAELVEDAWLREGLEELLHALDQRP